jgi:hypothetical protein
MAKYLTAIVMLFVSHMALAQSTKTKIEQTRKDPATTTRAAQADNRVVNNKTVTTNKNSQARTSPRKKMRKPVFKKIQTTK